MFAEATLYLDVSTPVGDEFTVIDVRGEEAISSLFLFRVTLKGPGDPVEFSEVVGKPFTLRISMEGGGIRYINGVVGRWEYVTSGVRDTTYFAELRPVLWKLTHTEDCRIYQNVSVPAIVESVFAEQGVSDYALELKSTYPSREYCVQYRETAFAFVSRLLEDEGIFYFFRHEEGRHTLVLADDNSAFAPLPNFPEAEMLESDGDHPSDYTIRTARVFEQYTTGRYAVDDYNFETPGTDLHVNAEGDSEGPTVFEYPGGFRTTAEGENLASKRMDARESLRRVVSGDGFCRDFVPGFSVVLKGHPAKSANDTYVLLRVQLNASQDTYESTFVAAPLKTPHRPSRRTPKPRISGSQTALVVGKKGEEIWTDNYGRIKLQFHWDHEGSRDENSSCWVRVGQGWAGKGWGRMFLPRIGQEAIVSFLEGDPDRPLVTGTVYNAAQTVPYALPGDQTRSTIKTRSSKGGGGFNELRFEDKSDAEEIYLHAQKDMNTHVLNHRQTFVQGGDPSYEDSIVDLLRVEGHRKITVAGAATEEVHLNEGTFAQNVSKEFTLKVDGTTLLIEAKGDLVLKGNTVTMQSTGGDVKINAAMSMSSEAGMSMKSQAGLDMEAKAGTTLKNSAGLNLTNEAGLVLENKGTIVKDQGSAMVMVQGAITKIG